MRGRMFLRMLVRAIMVRPGRVLGATLAVVVAATAVTAMLNLYTDVEAKLRREFRSYGANVVVLARSGQSLPADALTRVEGILGGRGIAAPFAYAIARTASGQPIVVAGTDFSRARRLDDWWQVTPQWPHSKGQALVGVRAAEVLGIQPGDQNNFKLNFEACPITLRAAGTLQTGAEEDSRIYLSAGDFAAWIGFGPSSIEVAVSGTARDVEAVMREISAALPEAEVHPVRQIMEAEGQVLSKTRKTVFATTLFIIVTAALCVLATLTAWVLDRRKDFAVMKALGASERLIAGFFAAEAAIIGIAGAIVGFAAGLGIAAWIGHASFHAPVQPRFGVFPVVLAGSVALAVVSALLPVSLLRRIQPAGMLRGE